MISEEGVIFIFIISKKSAIVLANLFQYFSSGPILKQMFLEYLSFC